MPHCPRCLTFGRFPGLCPKCRKKRKWRKQLGFGKKAHYTNVTGKFIKTMR